MLDPHELSGASLAEAGANLAGYVADLNSVFDSTQRRFLFDPAKDVESKSLSVLWGTCYDLAPGFTFVTYVANRNAFASCNFTNTNELWSQTFASEGIYSRAQLANEQVRLNYVNQVATMAHELAHNHGVGYGEYYSLRSTVDKTGVPPDLSIGNANGVAVDPAAAATHFYWRSRTKVLHDPMFMSQVRGLSSAEISFSPLSVAIINMNAQEGFLASCPAGTNYCTNVTEAEKGVTIDVLSEANVPLAGCSVAAYIQPIAGLAVPPTLAFSGTTSSAGVVSMSFKDTLDGTNRSPVALIKVACSGYRPGGDALSIFDFQARKLMVGGGAADDFHLGQRLTIRMKRA